MNIDAKTLIQLQTASNGFTTKNHSGYLAEALQCLREMNDPIAALKLLHKFWSSPFAERGEQKIALNDVGKWAEDRLYREPAIGVEQFALELGWLRRFTVVASKRNDDNKENIERGERKEQPTIAFGRRIEVIERRRAEAFNSRTVDTKREPPKKPDSPPPLTQLPDEFEAEFVDSKDAREARKNAHDRLKKKKTPNWRLLLLRPTNPQFVPLATNLYCSMNETVGFDLPFEEATRNDGKWKPFYVGRVEERNGKKVALVITLSKSSETKP